MRQLISLTHQTLRKMFDNVATCILLVVTVILILISIMSYNARQDFIENNLQANHTYNVINAIAGILSDLKDAETGERGYLLTGDRSYLQPFYRGVANTNQDFNTARVLLQGEARQEARLDDLQLVANQNIRQLELTLAVRSSGGISPALKLVKSGIGKLLMDSARTDVADMIGTEQSVLQRQTDAAITAGTFARTWSICGSLLGILLIGTAMIFVAGYLRQREAAEGENLRLIQLARDTAVQQRIFLKDVLSSVTEGRLSLCDNESELPSPLSEQGTRVALGSAPALRDLRQAAIHAARESGFSEERVQDLATSVSEAGMNAIIHGGGGEATVRADGLEKVQVWIKDQGQGISLDSLPQSTLKRGYSSAGSLGHGFWLMLQLTDRVYLMTGSEGTTIVLEQSKVSVDAPWTQREVRSSAVAFKTGVTPGDGPATNIANRYFRTVYLS